jgi:uncharacterized protein YkwD
MKHRTGVRRAILFIALTFVATLAASPLWSQDGDGLPVAIGFVTSDGETEVTYSVATSEPQADTSLGLSSIPSAPLGHLLVYATNLMRSSSGLPPLKVASELMESAQFHSDWMAEHNCFAHNCSGEPITTQRLEDAGYLNRTLSAEVIASGPTADTASEAVAIWMNSPQHHDIILSGSYREAGGGYAFSGTSDYYNYWTMDLGARNDAQGYPVYPVVINREAWSTTNLNVNLYVYGSDWAAEEMRFRNEGGSWSDWQSFSAQKNWTLSCNEGSPATVYAQIRKGGVVLESSDEIAVDIPLSVNPSQLVFLSEQGSGSTVPGSYPLEIVCCDQWTATPSESWIKLTEASGTGTSQTEVYLQGQPTNPGTYYGTITVQMESSQEETQVEVTLVVTNDPLSHSNVPLVSKEQS